MKDPCLQVIFWHFGFYQSIDCGFKLTHVNMVAGPSMVPDDNLDRPIKVTIADGSNVQLYLVPYGKYTMWNHVRLIDFDPVWRLSQEQKDGSFSGENILNPMIITSFQSSGWKSPTM
jgi:hypothetical protein